MELTFLKKINVTSRSECSRHKKARLITLILAGAGALFAMSEYGVTRDQDGRAVGAVFHGAFGIVLLYMAAAMILITTFNVFSDLTSKQDADVQLSLPMSSLERFCSKLMAIFKLNLGPVAGLSMVMLLICTFFGGYFGDFLENFKIFWVMIDLQFFALAMAVFCTSCCGAKAESRYTTIILGTIVSFMPMAFYEILISNYSGVSQIAGGDDIMERFTAFGALIIIAIEGDIAECWSYLTINLILSIALIVISYFIYQTRDAKSVGKPMVFKLFMETFLFLGVFMIHVIFLEMDNWAICTVITLVTYLVIRIVAARAKLSPGQFFIWVGKYFLAAGAFFVIAIMGYKTGGFGYYRAMPYIPARTVSSDISVRVSDSKGDRYIKLELEGADREEVKAAAAKVISWHDVSNRTVNDFWEESRRWSYYSSKLDPDGNTSVTFYISGDYLPTSGRNPSDGGYYSETLYEKSFYTNKDMGEIESELRALGFRLEDKYDDGIVYGDYEYDPEDWEY